MAAAGAPPRLLVLEPAPQGHGREWLQHLAEEARRSEPVPPLTFLVAPPVAAALHEALAADPVPGLEIEPLSAREVALCGHGNPAVSGLARWLVMRRRLRRRDAAEGLFLELDHLSLPLALGLPFGRGRAVSGILFRPSVHYAPGVWRHRDWRRDLRKDLLYRLMLRRRALARVLSLDEHFPAFARARYRGGGKVTALVDPAFPPAEPAPAERALAGRVPPGRRLLLLFGVLAERKGVPALLEALARLRPATAARTAVMLAGVVDARLRPALRQGLAELARCQPALWLHLEDRRIGAGELAALVEASEAVLAPYQRFVGSSGVLLWAASRGRPVIAQDYGLVGRLVREHGLGLAVDSGDPDALAAALERAVALGRAGLAEPAALARFAEGRTPQAFAAAVLARRASAPQPGDRMATSGHGLATRPAARGGV